MNKVVALTALLTLPACASISKGSTQSVLIETSPSGAECRVANENGQWIANPTPQSVSVKKASGPLTVSCTKGKMSGSKSVESTTDSTAYGNILAGGIVGAAIDMNSGAAYTYPAQVFVHLAND